MSVIRTLLSAASLRQTNHVAFPGFLRSLTSARVAYAGQDYGSNGSVPRSYGARQFQNVAPGNSNPFAQTSYGGQSSGAPASPSNVGGYSGQSSVSSSSGDFSPKDDAASFRSVFNDRSIYGHISKDKFEQEAEAVLQEPVDENLIEIRPDGMIYVPSVHYRRILNKAFGFGGWFLCPLSDPIVRDKFIIREYGLLCQGRLVSQTMGEHSITDPSSSFASNLEACKSNALTRAAKDLGIFSELHDVTYSLQWKSSHAERVMHENARTKDKRPFWRKIGRILQYPWVELRGNSANN